MKNDTGPPDPDLAKKMYPPPWRVEIVQGLNRARIWDAAGRQVVAGMNIFKAQMIVAAINRDVTTAHNSR